MTERSQPIDKDAVDALERAIQDCRDDGATHIYVEMPVDDAEALLALAHPTEQTDDAVVEALRFYANEATYKPNRTYMKRAISPIQRDRGEAAREALAKLAMTERDDVGRLREALERQVDAVIEAARNVEWEAHFGARWEQRASELAKARDHLLALAQTTNEAPPVEGEITMNPRHRDVNP